LRITWVLFVPTIFVWSKKMNMISTGAFQTEMDASNKQPTIAEKFAAVWEKKNGKAARAGGVSLMALSLAACGSDDDTPDTNNNAGVTPIASDLTNGSDTFTGTSGNDVITAGAVYTPGGNDRINSLQDEDVVNGGAGDDTINISVTTANDNGNVTITPTMSSVENINIAFNSSANASEIDLQDSTGAVDLAITRISSGTVTIDNIQDVLATVSLASTHEDTTVIDISWDDAVLVGTADSLALTVEDVEATDVNIQGEDGSGYETINMTAAGDISVSTDFEIDSTQTLDIGGAGDVTVANMSVSAGDLSAINASDATGDMDFDLGAADVVEARVTGTSGTDIDFTYTGSKGDDYIRVDEDSLSDGPTGGDDANGHDTIDGGTGDNTLDFTVDATMDLIHNDVTVSNIQDVHIDITGAVTADLDGQQFGEATGSADVDTITVRNNITGANIADFDLNDLDAGVLVRVQHSSDDANDDVGDTDVYIHQMDGTHATDDAQTVEIISGTNTSETFDFTLDIQANDADAVDVNDAAVESVTIIDSDTENNIVALSSVAEHDETLTLSGGRADDTFAITGNVIATTVDGRLQLSDVTLDLGAANQDIDMGSGDDNLYFQTADGFTDDDDVVGGDGTDVIWAGYTANTDSDLNVSGVEKINLDANANLTVDISESDDITTVGIVSNNHGDNVSGGDETTDINLIADSISVIHLISEQGAAADDYNGLTITDEGTGNPAAVTINVDDADDDAVNVGTITLDDDTTTLTINLALGDTTDANADAAVTTFEEISAASLTTLVVTDEYDSSDADSRELVLDLDDTTSLTSVDATGAQGGTDITIDGLADSANINLVQSDDASADATDNLTITFVGDTGADDVTITVGDAAHTITITNGDLDDLEINAGDGIDTVNLTGAQGDNIEINLGAGADVVTGSNDDDEIDLGAADTDTDHINVENSGSHDMITNFEGGTDDIDLNLTLKAENNTATVAFEAGAAGTDVAVGTTVFELTGVTTDGTANGLVTALGGTATNADIDAGDALVYIAYTTSGSAQLWHFVDADGANISAPELTLFATLTDVAADSLVTGDFV
jgi:hypothetical protein